MPHLDYMQNAGSEGMELVMWLLTCGALDQDVETLQSFYHVPASNTAVGHIILKNPAKIS